MMLSQERYSELLLSSLILNITSETERASSVDSFLCLV